MALVSETYLSTLSAKMKPYGIERNFTAILFLIENSGKVSQKDLCDFMKRDKVTVMRIVDTLCEGGFLVRKQNPNDRRCQILEVTSKATEIQEVIKEANRETNELLFSDFTAAEKEVFKRGMDKLMLQVDQLPASDFVIQAFKKKK